MVDGLDFAPAMPLNNRWAAAILSRIAIQDSRNGIEDMMTPAMISFPLPFMTMLLAGLAAMLALRQHPGLGPARQIFALFFALVAVIGMLTGLRFGYGVAVLALPQRVLPLFMGPLLYLGFASLSRPAARLRRTAAAHLGAALALGLLPQLVGGRAGVAVPDMLIATSYLVYAVLLAVIWWRGPNAMGRAPLEQVGALSLSAGLSAGLLCLLLVFDSLIAVFFARHSGAEATALISQGAMLMILVLLALVYRLSLGAVQRPPRPVPAPATPSRDETQALLARLDDLMTRESLFVDTTLTADRLARRLHVPGRSLSEAINQNRGMNISQYVNSFRLDRAARLLAETDLDLADVMAQSGFLTRSNFYREFQRRYGQSPIAWRGNSRTSRD